MNLHQAPANELDLQSAISELKQSLDHLRANIKSISERQPPKLERLEKAVAGLGEARAANMVLCPSEYLRQWKDLLTKEDGAALEWRVARFLCWEPEAVIDIRFHQHLDRHWPDVHSRSLQGMVRGCHMKWTRDLANGPAVERVRQRLEEYQGRNRLLERWRGASAMLLGQNGAQEFAREIIQCQSSIPKACGDWGLDEQTAYVAMAAEEAVDIFLSPEMTEVSAKNLITLLRWGRWTSEKFNRIVGKTIIHPLAEGSEEWRGELINFILNHRQLGDPRLDPTRWAGELENARKRFVQWLSKEDIVFFFDHVLRGNDRHGRRKFWLKYVGSLAQSRPLLRNDDVTRLTTEIKRLQGRMASYGQVIGAASSFILDFGTIVAIEFSDSGAIHFYDKGTFNQIVPNLWQHERFTESKLKQRIRTREWIAHRPDWEYKAKLILAQYGIRPG